MRRFELLQPRSIEEATALLAEHPDAKLIAGGTALLILIKQGVYVPGTLINLKKIRGVDEIVYDATNGLRIGALASIHAVERDAAVRQHYPVLAEACHVVANIRIRNLATIGGNLAHSDYQSDPPCALLALGASVELTSGHGTRAVPLSEFLIGTYETAIEPDEVLTAISVPSPPAAQRGSYLKFTTRSSGDRPAAAVTALATLNAGTLDDVRVVIGAVSPSPVLLAEASELARGQAPSAELFARIGRIASQAMDPIEDHRGSAAYKRHLVGVLAERALAQAVGAHAINGGAA
jgi:carbon-monoxide dehydrogenase medium subunit